MAARKQKAKPRGASRTPAAPARKPVPAWLMLAGGAAIGGFIVFLAQLEPGRDEVKRAPPTQPESAAKPATPPAPQRPKYEFYEELTKASPAPLPGEQPTPEQVQAAEAARAQALLEGRTPPPRLVATPPVTTPVTPATPATATTPAPAATPRPAPAPAPAAVQTPPQPARPAPAQPAAKPAATPAVATTHFVLQAGSFGSRDQAESARARLLLLGQDARVESGEVGGRTVHRVVVGPFASRSQADGAQKQLGASGIGSVVQQRR